MSDDTAAVQALIDTAWQSGGVVQLDARDYTITGLTIPSGVSRSITLRGTGRSYIDGFRAATASGTRLICTNGASAIGYDGGASGLKRPTITIEHLTILGPNELNDRSNYGSGHGIRINGNQAVPLVFIRDVLIAGFYGGCGVWLSNCENGSVTDTHALFCGTGFHGDVAYNANTHANLSAERCIIGIVIENSESLSFSGGMAQSNEGNGMVLRNVTAAHVAAMHFENNNRLSVPDSWAVLIEGGQGIGFEQCSFVNPRDKAMIRNSARAVRFVGGKNIASAPAITLLADVHGTRIDECVPPASVSGAARIIWDGAIVSLMLRSIDEHAT